MDTVAGTPRPPGAGRPSLQASADSAPAALPDALVPYSPGAGSPQRAPGLDTLGASLPWPAPIPTWVHQLEDVHSAALRPLPLLVDALALEGACTVAGLPAWARLVAPVAVLVIALVVRTYRPRDSVATQGVLWYPALAVLPVVLGVLAADALTGVLAAPAAPPTPARVLVAALTGVGALTAVRVLTWTAIAQARHHTHALHPTVVLGPPGTAAYVVERLRRTPRAGLAPVAVRELQALLAAPALLADELRAGPVDHVILVPEHVTNLVHLPALWRDEGLSTFFSMIAPLPDLNLLSGPRTLLGGLSVIPLGQLLAGPARFVGKRTADVLLAAVALVAASPLLLAAALAVRLGGPGGVLYRQRRVGRNGVPFTIYKFRTMCPGAEAAEAQLRARNMTDGLLFKVPDDPRITRVGNLLRRTSVDELPQLLNVLRGEMSLVGPRPLAVEPHRFQGPAVHRHLVPPGMTGLWQVSGGNRLSYEEMIRLDLAYVYNWSLWLDVRLLLTTVATLVQHPDG